ncbi:MAG: hypothetical protein U0V64_14315 [Cyclobacteriaceae bacterium]
MTLVPIFRVTNLRKAVAYYTSVFPFELAEELTDESPVALLRWERAWLMLSVLPGDQPEATSVNVWIADLDALVLQLQGRGYQLPDRPESPVHSGIVLQTWGTRELYITDADGNTLRLIEVQ